MDRMVAETVYDGVEPRPVTGVASFAGRDADDLAVAVDRERPTKILFPPTEPDHLVVSGPGAESIVAGMPDVHAAAVAHERLEILLHRPRPGRTAPEVVAGLNDDIVVRKFRPPGIPAGGVFGGRSG